MRCKGKCDKARASKLRCMLRGGMLPTHSKHVLCFNLEHSDKRDRIFDGTTFRVFLIYLTNISLSGP